MEKICALCKQPAAVAAKLTKGEQTATVYLCGTCLDKVKKKIQVEIISSTPSISRNSTESSISISEKEKTSYIDFTSKATQHRQDFQKKNNTGSFGTPPKTKSRFLQILLVSLLLIVLSFGMMVLGAFLIPKIYNANRLEKAPDYDRDITSEKEQKTNSLTDEKTEKDGVSGTIENSANISGHTYENETVVVTEEDILKSVFLICYEETINDLESRVQKQPGFSLHDHVPYESENKIALVINYDPSVNGEDPEITYISYVDNERSKNKYTRVNKEIVETVNHYMPNNVDTEIVYFHGDKIIYIFENGEITFDRLDELKQEYENSSEYKEFLTNNLRKSIIEHKTTFSHVGDRQGSWAWSTSTIIPDILVLHFDHWGTGHCSFTAYDENGNSTLLVNTIGDYSGETMLLPGHIYDYEVRTDGYWSLDIGIIGKTQDTTFSGTGDFVSSIFVPGSKNYYFSHDGSSNFVVWLHTNSGDELLVNTIGSYSGSVRLECYDDLAIFEIKADGNWTAVPME